LYRIEEANMLAALLLSGTVALGAYPALALEGDSPDARSSAAPRPPASQSEFLAEIHRMLKSERGRAIEISEQLSSLRLGRQGQFDQLTNQEISTRSAHADYENAKLTREVAEIAIVEYTEGIFVRDQMTLEGELTLARSDLDRQRDMPEMIEAELAEVAAASDGSVWDLSAEFRLNDWLAVVHRRERKARLEVAKLERKLKIMNGFTKSIRTRELQMEVEAARADELAKRAAYEESLAKEKRLAAAAGVAGDSLAASRSARLSLMRLRVAAAYRPEPAAQPDAEPLRSLLDQATSIDKQIRGLLDQIASDGKLDSSRRDQVTKLVQQLRVTIDQADAERSAFQLARWKPWIRRAARQAAKTD
jgi:hypothetical protein